MAGLRPAFPLRIMRESSSTLNGDLRNPHGRQNKIPLSHHGDSCTTAYSVMGKALRPLPQSAGEGWDGVQTGDIDNTWTGHMGNTLQSLAGATLNVAEVPYHRSTL